jgi:hypothetical protein
VIPCYVFITRAWIMSTRAKTLYLICAILTAAMFLTIVALQAAMIFADVPLEQSIVVRVLAFPILLSGVFGTATLWVAMWYHWFGYNKDSELSKGFWLVCFILFGPLASIFYYFFPYRWSFRSILET